MRNRARYRIDASINKEEVFSVLELAKKLLYFATLKKDSFFGGEQKM
ncbi:MAG: hypothetical protein N2257_03870 [Thermodesulfovibrionales bacterium]|nr:hypothetical protein [Thermodesulfovibrionales bacterium]